MTRRWWPARRKRGRDAVAMNTLPLRHELKYYINEMQYYVLSGILAATASVAPDPLTAAVAAAWINGKAGELAQERMGSVAMTAGDTAGCIAEIIHTLETAP